MREWYIFRAVGGVSAAQLAVEVAGTGVESYIPTYRRAQAFTGGAGSVRVEQEYAALPGVLFVRADAAGLVRLQGAFSGRALLSRDAEGRPGVVAEETVVLMKYALRRGGGAVRFLPGAEGGRPGEAGVRIEAGPLAGVRGYVRRIRKDRKFLVPVGSYAVLVLPREVWGPTGTAMA